MPSKFPTRPRNYKTYFIPKLTDDILTFWSRMNKWFCSLGPVQFYIMPLPLPPLICYILRRHIWCYSVCLCPMKRTTGLYGLISMLLFLHHSLETTFLQITMFLNTHLQILHSKVLKSAAKIMEVGLQIKI